MLENHTMIYQKVSNRIISVWNIRLHWLTIVVFLCFIQIFWLTDLLSKTGWHETRYKCGALRIRRYFIEELWEQSALLPEDEWRTMARQKLVEFEDQLHEAFSAGLTSYSGKRTWGYWDGVAFSMTTVSTIGKALNFSFDSQISWFIFELSRRLWSYCSCHLVGTIGNYCLLFVRDSTLFGSFGW